MADTQTYGHTDIQRYLQHKMTPQEMHDFEKALMNDPFLADALEGFSSADDIVTRKHLNEIESELTGEKQEGKVVPMPLQKTAWWKVAAVVLAIISSGALTYSLLSKIGAEKNIVQQIAPAEAAKTETKTDSIRPVEKPLVKMNILPKKELSYVHKSGSPMIREKKEVPFAMMKAEQMKTDSPGLRMTDKGEEFSASINKNADVVTTLNSRASTNNKQAVELKKMASAPVSQAFQFKGRIVDTAGHAVPAATIIVNNSDTGTSTDAEGNFTLKAKDSVVQINVNAVDFSLKELTIKNNDPVNIVLDKTNPLSEVVVTSMIKERKKSNRKRSKEEIAKGAEPEGGWKNFEQYLNRQTESIKANNPNNHYDTGIEIEFSLDKDGKPTDIKTLDKIDSITAKKAIQILTNGPKWKNKKKSKKLIVIIPFE